MARLIINGGKSRDVVNMKQVHFIGICGAGMSATAKLLRDLGWQVSGSDENFYPPVSVFLESSGIRFFKNYRKDNIPDSVDSFVIGKHAGLTPEENAEARAAFASGRPVKSFAEVLGEITRGRENIVAAGSYGKSTCASLLAWCLERTGKNPGYFIGAVPETPPVSSAVGKTREFILEGDEYPAANWDSRSKFCYYHPSHLLLTSLAHDHLNIFKTEADYRRPFCELINMIPENGVIAACADGAGVRETVDHLGRRAQFYSVDENTPWRARNINYGEITTFDLVKDGEIIVQLNTRLLGRHNVENIISAGALLLSLNLVSVKEFAAAIASFKPLQRRLDRKSDKTAIPIYEGFGSSYDKARAALEAVKLHFPDRKLAVVFEPHTFSWRSRQAIGWYDKVFAGADYVLIYKPPQNSPDPDQLSREEITKRVRKTGVSADSFDSPEAGLKMLFGKVDPRTVVLILSSGGFDGVIESIVKTAEEKFSDSR